MGAIGQLTDAETYLAQRGSVDATSSFPITRQQAASDRRKFMQMHGNTATAEELEAELAAEIRAIQASTGKSVTAIANDLNVDREACQCALDPEYKARFAARKRRAAKRYRQSRNSTRVDERRAA